VVLEEGESVSVLLSVVPRELEQALRRDGLPVALAPLDSGAGASAVLEEVEVEFGAGVLADALVIF
jgi:hypothetical protein